jgi:hypothetical protein
LRADAGTRNSREAAATQFLMLASGAPPTRMAVLPHPAAIAPALNIKAHRPSDRIFISAVPVFVMMIRSFGKPRVQWR